MKKLGLLAALVILAVAAFGTGHTKALSGSQFQAGRIIDDSVFFTGDNISPGDIQAFLNSKVPSCDTNGAQPYGGTTRAAYGTSKGNPPPYICLRYFSQDTPSRGAEAGLCNQYSGGVKSAASIIYDVSQACGINPRVMIVLLQKEQALVTDDWPWNIQYRSATGYGCPDTAPCDAEYYGFFNQVYNAARQFKRYQRDASLFSYRANRNNFIQYNPNAGCGGSNIFIQNQATAGLYNYTPYQPNQAALNNLYGTGDGCSAYGNRNFWRMFNDWFGGVNGAPYYWQLVSQEAYSDAARTRPYTSIATTTPNGKIYVRIKARNQGYQTWENTSLRIGNYSPADRTSIFQDGSWLSSVRPAAMSEATVAPSEVATFNFVLNAPSSQGTYIEHFNLVADGVTWLNDIGLYYLLNVVSPAAPVNNSNTVLNTGETLHLGEYLLSPDAQSVFALQKDGNLVLYGDFLPLWNTGTPGQSTDRLVMQGDGNLVLYNKDNVALWTSATSGTGTKLVTQTDGNLVIYNGAGTPLWSTSTVHNPDHLRYVNNFAYSGAGLYPGQSLETADRRYRLTLQTDGNLVLYSPNRAIWQSATAGMTAAYLAIQGDGNLVLYDANGRPLWNTGTPGRGFSALIIQGDGNLVLYDNAARPSWNTATPGVQ